MESRQVELKKILASKEEELRSRYGDVICVGDLAQLFHFPSVAAIQKARARGRFPVALARLPNRRGWYTTPKAVAEVLVNLEVSMLSTEKEVQP